ncbi:hypothetical protein PTTG_12572 [Puccinia triticina 1-1 BBBD Race 1]|uniref:Rrn7/TAF1B N-terminal cyclin domain-containing protein n=2 Tax=Puccinia triticina TaxID=208348 RepID=A0A180GKM9_PUCT1|nr:uncharacterized protein PtA15_11A99 [Puccinia triticina]OAV93185.1 hypothetical protein PTTG_12572 [Puccinia triticina 1-1 BBBD Race 1]WAQ89411.1 hypothetical protein PtA15_11A99 [Puccinia triticina]WAR59466.1 hypothetical protein PtB15_11B106 [Puccinia triticina]
MSQPAYSQHSRQHSVFSQTPSQSTVRSSASKNHRTCPRCGSRKWRRDPNRGVVVCGEGHVLEGFLRESTEQTEASQYSLRKRRLSAAPRQRKSYIPKAAYQDQRARILLVQALTVLIRKQIEALIQIINAPSQLEEIAQTLWKAYLSALDLDDSLFVPNSSSSPVIASSRFGDDSQSAGYSSQDADSSHTTSRRTRPSSSNNSVAGGQQTKTQLTPEALKALTQEHSESSDQSSDNSSSTSSASSSSDSSRQSTPPTGKSQRPQRRYRRAHAENIKIHPRMVVTICTIYLACLKLRLPIILQDLINFISTKQLPHIGFIHSIPSEVQKKMNQPVMQSLSAEKPPRLFCRRDHSNGLVHVCRQLLKIFQEANPSVLLPENTTPNLTLLVLRFSKALLLPDYLQLLALNLVRRLDNYFLTFSPLSCASRSMSSSASTKSTDRRGALTGNKALSVFRIQMVKYPPEWFIMAVVYIVAQSAIVASCPNDPRDSDDGSSSDENPEDLDQMLQLVTQFIPNLDQWYHDLTQTIKLDEDQKPQTLWEKNLEELDSKEIDSYIAFAKDFLLKDQPEPSDIAFKNQFFPLCSPSTSDMNGGPTTRKDGNRGASQRTIPDASSHPAHGQSADKSHAREMADQTARKKSLKHLLLSRGSELVGCSVSNHSHLDEFVKVYAFVNSFFSKQI